MSTLKVATVALVAVQVFGYSHAAEAQPSGCVNADPARVLANVKGDFELAADPQDGQGNLIYISNVASGASRIVAARIDGTTGNVIGGSLTTVADNWSGDTSKNGPEFVQQPNGSFGIIYRGPQGVHAVFRAIQPSNWNAFKFTVNGAAITGSPPPLPSTIKGNYAGAAMPLGQRTYSEFNPTQTKAYYGPLSGGQLTDIVAVLTAQGLTLTAGAQSPRDGYIIFSANSRSSGSGIYEAQVNGAGGITSGTLVKLASAPAVPQESMRAIRHPATNTTVLYTNAGNGKISIWEQPATGGTLRLIKTVTGKNSGHYRTEEGGNTAATSKVVLHYYVRNGSTSDKGSYTLAVTASGQTLVVGVPKKISAVAEGSELAWLPFANKWALYYGNSGITRCFVTP